MISIKSKMPEEKQKSPVNTTSDETKLPAIQLLQTDRKQVTSEDVVERILEWQKTIVDKPLDSKALFDSARLPLKGGVPSSIVLHPLYNQPNVYPPSGKPEICTIALGLKRAEYDCELDVEPHWQFLEPPERMVRKDFNAFQSVSNRGDVSMFWKMHAVMGDEPFIALNPIQFSNHWPQEQEFVIDELKQLLAKVDEDKPRQAFKIRSHLKWAIRKMEDVDGPLPSVSRYPERDKVAVAMGISALNDLGIDSLAFPSIETLRSRWPSIGDGVVGHYRQLEEFCLSGNHGKSVFEFQPDLSLIPAKR